MSRSFRAKVGRRGLLAGVFAAGAAVATAGGTAVAQARDAGGAAGRTTVTGRSGDSLAGQPVPQVLSAMGDAALAPDFPIEYIGLTWTGGRSAGRIRLRTRAGWGRWRQVRRGDSSGDGRQVALIPAGRAARFQLAAAPGADDISVLAINATDGPPVSGMVFPRTIGRRFGCLYRNRGGWGGDESLRFGGGGAELWPAQFHATQTLTVHHAVTANGDADPAATVRAIYFFQAVTERFGDIGYHLLIDEAGVVYEGRYSGSDGVPVFGPAAGSAQMVGAGHTAGFNAGNIGVALLGDLTSTQPTAAARRSLTRVLTSLAQVAGLDPRGTTNYVNPISGDTRTVNTISAHRDWLATECPGNAFYPQLPSLRADVASLLAGGVPIR